MQNAKYKVPIWDLSYGHPKYVILSEAAQSAAKSKNLRTCDNIFGQIGAKILRLAPLAQDDTVVTTERQTEI